MVKTSSTSVSSTCILQLCSMCHLIFISPMFWEIQVPKHKEEKTVFCFLSYDLAVGPTHEFEHRSLNPPANAQVMKAITQEHDSSKRVMMTCPVTLTNVTRTDPFKVNRHNVTKEALLWCNLPQRFLDRVVVRVTKVRHVHPSWPGPFCTRQR